MEEALPESLDMTTELAGVVTRGAGEAESLDGLLRALDGELGEEVGELMQRWFAESGFGTVMLWAVLCGVADAGAEGGGLASLSLGAPEGLVVCQAEAFDLPPQEAIEHFRDLEVVTREEFDALDAAARARSFTVAGFTDEYVLEELKNSVQRAIEDGETVTGWLNRVEDTLDSMGMGTRGGRPLWHLRLIYNQNVAQAYGAGRYVQMQRSLDTRPYWQYHSVGDERVRAEHAALDGIVRRADDEFWQRYYPPWDYGCRCFVTSVAPEEMAEEGLREATDDDIREAYEQAAGGAIRVDPERPGWPPRKEGFGNPGEFFGWVELPDALPPTDVGWRPAKTVKEAEE